MELRECFESALSVGRSLWGNFRESSLPKRAVSRVEPLVERDEFGRSGSWCGCMGKLCAYDKCADKGEI